ncbi:hypothetical protein H5410_022369, partial [Solanum commersonii]
MNIHNKTQTTYAKFNCVLKDSSYGTPIPMILKLVILHTCASSSSTKRIRYNTHTQKEEHNACFHPQVYPYFPMDFRIGLLKIKQVFSWLVMGLSAK